MKTESKVSIFSVVCALCAMTVSGAWAASSVRALGGAGTYNGASTATVAAPVAARSGSIRLKPGTVTGTAVKTTGMNTPSTTPGRGAATQRLSLGKYLGAGYPISVSTKPGTGNGGNGDDGRKIEMQVTNNNVLQYKYEGDKNWTDLVELESIASREIEMRTTARNGNTWLQYRYNGDKNWTDLVELPNGFGGGDLYVSAADETIIVDSVTGEIRGNYIAADDYLEINGNEISLNLSNLVDGLNGQNGLNGREIQMKVAKRTENGVTQDWIMYKYNNETALQWKPLIAVQEIITTNNIAPVVNQFLTDNFNNYADDYMDENFNTYGDQYIQSHVDGVTITQGADNKIKGNYTGSNGITVSGNVISIDAASFPDIPNIEGKKVLLQADGSVIQWKYEGDSAWNNLIDLATQDGLQGAKGDDGAPVELRFNEADKIVQWKYTTESATAWRNLDGFSQFVTNILNNKQNSLSAGDGIDADALDDDDEIKVKAGNNTITVDSDGVKGNYTGSNGITVSGNVISIDAASFPDIPNIEGKKVLLQADGSVIQWQYEGDSAWTILIDLTTQDGLKGADGNDGDPVELRFNEVDKIVQWKYTTESSTAWRNLDGFSQFVTNILNNKQNSLSAGDGIDADALAGDEIKVQGDGKTIAVTENGVGLKNVTPNTLVYIDADGNASSADIY